MKNILTFILLFVSFSVSAQAKFQIGCGGTVNYQLSYYALEQTKGGSILAAGRRNSGGIVISKIDKYGRMLWSKEYIYNTTESICDLKKINDNLFVLTGSLNILGKGSDLLHITFDSNGVIQRSLAFGTSFWDSPQRTIIKNNEVFIVWNSNIISHGIAVTQVHADGSIGWHSAYMAYSDVASPSYQCSVMDFFNDKLLIATTVNTTESQNITLFYKISASNGNLTDFKKYQSYHLSFNSNNADYCFIGDRYYAITNGGYSSLLEMDSTCSIKKILNIQDISLYKIISKPDGLIITGNGFMTPGPVIAKIDTTFNNASAYLYGIGANEYIYDLLLNSENECFALGVLWSGSNPEGYIRPLA